MRNRQVKKLRRIAKEFAHNRNDSQLVQHKITGQRRQSLHAFSEKLLLKRMKRLHKNIAGPLRHMLIPALNTDIKSFKVIPE